MKRAVLLTCLALPLLLACPPGAVVPVQNLDACVLQVESSLPATASVFTRIAAAVLGCGADALAVISSLERAHAKEPAILTELAKARAFYAADPAGFRMKLRAVVPDAGP